MQRRRLSYTLERPGRDIAEALVVSKGFTVGGLALFSEVAAARLRAMESIERQ